ncbi:hypothetical protein [Bacillus solimangrovi]|uniref:Uncharacterized protein n=1 Tax=Bacillus solimangrovi TaxID=1305675 RepID=A0A1E5LH04_9BACI|nr:hypothetical protein [Bacillus solimangrovi]OEH93357.1 hypothetical protein BFG57_11935 [Bacillus solimangrovi]
MKKLFLLFVLFSLIACSSQVDNRSNSEITIKPYELSEQEQELVNNTTMEPIEYFVLDGDLQEDEDLLLELVVVEKGIEKGLMSSSKFIDKSFDHELFSFSFRQIDELNRIEFQLGIINGLGTSATAIEENFSMFSWGKVIQEKTQLTKDQPVNVAYMSATNKGEISRSVVDALISSPEDLKNYEFVAAYRITLVDKK